MPANRKDWERVGRMLAARRVQISARYASRKTFADDTGVNWRTLHDAEFGKRATFKPDTVRSFETAYRLVPGSIDRALADPGAELEPLPIAQPAPVSEVAPVVPLTLSLDDEEATIRHILDLPSPAGGGEKVAWGVRRGMIRSLLDLNDRRRNSEAGLPVPLALCN